MNWIELPHEMTVDIEALTKLIEQIGRNDFDIALLHFMNLMADRPILEISGYIVKDGSKPTIAGWCGVRADIIDRASRYAEALFEYDPIFKHLPDSTSHTVYYACCQIAEDLEDNAYRKTMFEQAGFKADVSVVRKENWGWNLAKYYVQTPPENDASLAHLGQIGALSYPLGKKHAMRADDHSLRRSARPKAEDRLMVLLENRFPQLTQREREVCALTILGNTTQSVAEHLSISPNTVITYRQRVYDRLGVNNTNALLNELI